MSWFGGLEVGDHVRASHDITDGMYDKLAGRTSIPRGRTGIVREVSRGLFNESATVEFHDGMFTRTVRHVPGHHLRKTGGHGEASFSRSREWRRGVRLGLLACNIPLMYALVRYYLAGGTTAGLVPAALMAVADTMVTLLGHPVIALAIAGVVFLRVRAGRRPGA